MPSPHGQHKWSWWKAGGSAGGRGVWFDEHDECRQWECFCQCLWCCTFKASCCREIHANMRCPSYLYHNLASWSSATSTCFGAPCQGSYKSWLAYVFRPSLEDFLNRVIVGYTHDLVTSMHVINTILEGGPEDQHSWFPGYSWTICKCISCLDQVVRFLITQIFSWHVMSNNIIIWSPFQACESGLRIQKQYKFLTNTHKMISSVLLRKATNLYYKRSIALPKSFTSISYYEWYAIVNMQSNALSSQD